MGDLEQYYYKLSVYLLSSLGLWPGESTILRRIQKVGYSIILAVSLINQLASFITTPYSTIFVLHNMPMIIITMGSILKYFVFLFQSDNIKTITELIKHDWSTAKDDEESKIIRHHAAVGNFYTTTFAKFLYSSVALCLLSLYTPLFLDLVAPLNETRTLQFWVTFEVFVDQQKYFHILALILCVQSFTVGTVYLATESVYLMWQQHQTSQFKIYAYRVRKAFLGNSVELDILNRNASIIKILASALDMHERALRLGVCLRKFWWAYFILLGFVVTSVSVFLYRLSKVLKNLNNYDELVLCAVLIIVGYGYMYFTNNMMQRVIDSYDNVCVATYNTNWYAAPMYAQKMLLFVMLRNMQPLNNKMCGMFSISMSSFMTQAKLTLSYLTMIHSMQ